jgi:ubiquinone/menaquinone biosynthesis C-methylase UbiE
MMPIDCETLRAVDDFLLDVKERCYELMNLRPGDRILDTGCGLGLDLQRLQHQGVPRIDAVGVDLRYDLFKSAWRAAEKQGAKFAAADCESLPFADNTFDTVWANRLLQHVRDPIAALVEIKRVAKSDGRAVLADSDHTSAAILCNGKAYGQRLMDFRAGTIRNGAAGRMLIAWCEQAALRPTRAEVIGINIENLGLARRMGLFFGDWDEKFRQAGSGSAAELDDFLKHITKCDRSNAFQFVSKFHVVCASK